MEESNINRYTPGGNPEMGNPSTSLEVAELRSDSGGGSILLDSEPTVEHLAVGTTLQASSGKMEIATPAGGASPRSISSRLEKVQIDRATDDEQSVYVALNRPLWAICIACVVIACSSKHGGIGNQLFSFKGWIPLAGSHTALIL
ncbi:uncharacterized protein LOC112453072 [Temnothorax curvispinosus]|uniref:Uncharacterized protein LOC112453072 n=1 Tax=Temnothorax curvispinosus TaxID=300111 RepID=A0A6J1PJA4_9HYME|nr:uncharacterized protein LOC112453072 [Temnothorax curvispinosus]